ncbi:Hsp20/alpha crystallin family protein [candidate division FCPU426 bacterium]|nr:Hsp20/alpha crystallin family protein [candidate division FCPU426 bacterium]
MTLVRWSPYRTLRGFEREMSNLLGDYMWGGASKGDGWLPAVEIVEKKDSYEMEVELPGVDKKDVKLKLDDNVLTIEGEKKALQDAEGDDYKVCERCYGTFSRSFTLPYTADKNKIAAEYKNGILHLSIAKSEQSKPKEIDIK